MRIPEEAFRGEHKVSPTGLAQPASYSRVEDRVASYGELLVSRFPENARRLGLTAQPPEPPLPLSGDLTVDELKAITLSVHRAEPSDSLLIGGPSRDQRINQISQDTMAGDNLMAMTRRLLWMREQTATHGILKLIPDPRP